MKGQTMTLDKATARHIHERIRDAVTAALGNPPPGGGEAAFLERSGCSYDPRTGEIKIRLQIRAGSGDKAETEAADFERDCHIFGLQPADYKRAFMYGKKQWQLVGFNFRSRRYPILARDQNGKRFGLPSSVVQHEPFKTMLPPLEVKTFSPRS